MSRNKSLVLLGEFAGAIRPAYKCRNKICLPRLAAPPSLSQPRFTPCEHMRVPPLASLACDFVKDYPVIERVKFYKQWELERKDTSHDV